MADQFAMFWMFVGGALVGGIAVLVGVYAGVQAYRCDQPKADEDKEDEDNEPWRRSL